MEIQALVDRAAIHDVLGQYATLVDAGRTDEIGAAVFTADAVEEHGYGIPASHGREEINAFLAQATSAHLARMHLLSILQTTVDGDTARTRTYYLALHWSDTGVPPAENTSDWISAGEYVDDWRREPEGWRISHRRRQDVGPSSLVLGRGAGHLYRMGDQDS